MNENAKFFSAFKAFDGATVRGRASASLLAMWGGIEQLFSPSGSELRFRTASLLSACIEPAGEKRLTLYKELLSLFNQRSVAAHTAKEIDKGPLTSTFVVMRNALMKIMVQLAQECAEG